MADLLYLQAPVRRPAVSPTLPPTFGWQTYCPENHSLFADTISASYQHSLDCPALNGLRNIDDIIAGHKATGCFQPELWFLLLEADKPQAVLLLNTLANATLELVYLGLVPSARGRGLGNLLMQQTLACASRIGADRLYLAVDALNVPALKLYFRCGLQRVCAKTAVMCDLRRSGSSL